MTKRLKSTDVEAAYKLCTVEYLTLDCASGMTRTTNYFQCLISKIMGRFFIHSVNLKAFAWERQVIATDERTVCGIGK